MAVDTNFVDITHFVRDSSFADMTLLILLTSFRDIISINYFNQLLFYET